jgi:hypothetical protein
MRDQRGLVLRRDPHQRRTTAPEFEFRKEKPATWMNWPEKNQILEQAAHSSQDEQQIAREKERCSENRNQTSHLNAEGHNRTVKNEPYKTRRKN